MDSQRNLLKTSGNAYLATELRTKEHVFFYPLFGANNFIQGRGAPGSRKVTSSASSAVSRLAIWEPLQSQIYVFLGTT